MLDLTSLYIWNDDLRAAEKTARQAISIYSQTVPELYPDRIAAQQHLGAILLGQNRVNEAAAVFEPLVEKEKLLYGELSRQVANAYSALADVRQAQGLLDDAEKYSRQALDIAAKTVGEEHYQTAYFCTSLAALLAMRGKLTESEDLLRRSLETYSKTLPPDHQYVASSEYLLGDVLFQKGEFADAEAMLTASMNRWKRTDAAPWRTFRSESALGEVLYREGRYKEAEHYLTESYKGLAADEKADRAARIKARERIARFYQERGELQKLQALVPAPPDPASVAVNK